MLINRNKEILLLSFLLFRILATWLALRLPHLLLAKYRAQIVMEAHCVLGALEKDGKMLVEQLRPVGDVMGINIVIHVMEKDLFANKYVFPINEYEKSQ